MIIADKNSWNSDLGKKGMRYFFIGIVVAVLLYFLYPVFFLWQTHQQPGVLFFDAEHQWRKSFISNGQFFSGGKHQSHDMAHTGRYSYRVGAGKAMSFGVSGSFLNAEVGKQYRASVWYFQQDAGGKAGIAVNCKEPGVFHEQSAEVVDQEKGWKKLELRFELPASVKGKDLKAFVYTNGVGDFYFDDLLVEQIETVETEEETIAAFNPPNLNLKLSRKAYAKIKSKRDEAKRKGVLIKDEDSWVKANLRDGEAEVPAKIRLKGDWTDHLDGDKWSFRVKIKDPYSWNRLIVFSLQTPRARYHVDEWMIHQFWEREDVLTTRYDFGRVSLNDKPLGVYAIEEHFDKQLLEYKKRREGPIIRFVEDALWDVRQILQSENARNHFPAVAELEVADIQPFKEGRTAGSAKLREDFEIARTLLSQFQTGEKGAAEIFDLERLGKFYAISDIMGAQHCLIWHNQRFYYNPINGKLEPIGYDAFSGKAPSFPLLLGQGAISYSRPQYVATLKRLVQDQDFLHHYFKYLKQFSAKTYLDAMFADLEKGLQNRVTYIQQEFGHYNFDKKAVYLRAQQARLKLYPLANHSVRAYWNVEAQSNPTLSLRNLHETPLVFAGTSTDSKRMTYPLEEPQFLSAYHFGYPAQKHNFTVPIDARYAFYHPYGVDTLFSTPISTWSAKLKPVPAQELMPKKALATNDWYEVKDGVIRFRPDVHTIEEDIIIPAGFRVFIPHGTQLDFRKGAKFISYSPLDMQGTNDDPIRIVSSDQSARGFTVLQAGATSNLNFVIFDHFNTLKDRGWQLTGAVTFYESDVQMNHCIFENNHCEDGLNIIRSKFHLNEVTVRNTPSDGFDADFCEGLIRNSHFTNTGNDGVDFSGSVITIESCYMKKVGDKGISAGEDSEVRVKSAVVEGAVIGAASKDLSYLRIENIELKDCNQGFAAYQKKPEYGPSIIQVDNYKQEDIRYLYTIAPGCTLRLKNKSIFGEQ